MIYFTFLSPTERTSLGNHEAYSTIQNRFLKGIFRKNFVTINFIKKKNLLFVIEFDKKGKYIILLVLLGTKQSFYLKGFKQFQLLLEKP